MKSLAHDLKTAEHCRSANTAECLGYAEHGREADKMAWPVDDSAQHARHHGGTDEVDGGTGDHSLTQKQIGRARQVARVRIHERSHGDESAGDQNGPKQIQRVQRRSAGHTSEHKSLMPTSDGVLCVNTDRTTS